MFVCLCFTTRALAPLNHGLCALHQRQKHIAPWRRCCTAVAVRPTTMAPYRCAAVHVPVPQHPHRHVADATTTTTTTTTAAAAAAAAAAVPPIPPIPCRGCRGCRAASVPSSLRCHHHRCRATIEPQLQQRSRATELSPKSPPHTPRAFMHAASFHLSCVHHRAAAVHLPVTNAVRSISLLIFTRSAMGAEGKDIDATPEAIRRCRHDATFSHTLLTSKKTVALNDAFFLKRRFAITGFRKHTLLLDKKKKQKSKQQAQV